MLINFLQQHYIHILFELVIFLILVVQLYQLTVEYALPALREQIAALYKRWKDLEDKLDLTKNTKKSLKKKIKEQTNACQELEKNVQQWHTNLAEKQAKNELQQAALALVIREKKQQQLARLTMLQAKKSILPDAIAQTKQKLQKECSGPEGKKLLSNVINSLGKS